MFCSNCGKEIDVESKFCHYCGTAIINSNISSNLNSATSNTEFVVYRAKKHWMALLPVYLTLAIFVLGFFVSYDVQLLVNSIYYILFTVLIWAGTILRFLLDKIEVTNKTFYMRQGIFNIDKLVLPVNKIQMVYVKQSLLGRLLNYGDMVFESGAKNGQSCYRYIKNPDKLNYVLNNLDEYIKKTQNITEQQ